MRFTIIIGSLICIALLGFLFFREDPSVLNEFDTAPQKKQIGFYHYFSGAMSGGFDDMVNEVNQSQAKFLVKAHPLDHEAFKSMILSTLDKANPPELFSYWAGARLQHLVDQNKLAPIDHLWEQQQLDSRFPESIVQAACTYNGKKYLLPIGQHLVVFFYNTRIFEENQLEPPRTWKAFLQVCRRLKANGITPIALGAKERWPAQFWLDYLLLRSQPADYRNRLMQGQARYTDPQVKTVYRTWSELLTKGYFNANANDLDWTQATRLVGNKDAAMTLMGSWAVQLLQELNEKKGRAETTFDFFPFPQVDPTIPKVSLGPIDGIVLSKNAVNLDFSQQTLVYFASQKAQKKMSQGSGAFAPSTEVPLSFYSPFTKRMINEIQTAASWAFNYDLATPPGIAEVGMDSFQELIAFPDQYEQILENVNSEVEMMFNHIRQE